MTVIFNIVKKYHTESAADNRCESMIAAVSSEHDIIRRPMIGVNDHMALISSDPGRRKDSVIAVCFQVVMLCKNGLGESLEAFFEHAEKWVYDTFGDDRIHCMVKMRKANKFVLESVMIPINENGRLSAYSFFRCPKKLSDLNKSVYESMKPLGAEPLKSHTAADYALVDAFYDAISTDTACLPCPLVGEKPEEYRKRAQEEYTKLCFQLLHRRLMIRRFNNETQTYLNRLKPSKNGMPLGTPGEHISDLKARIKRLDEAEANREYWLGYISNIKNSGLTDDEKNYYLSVLKEAVKKAKKL